MFNCKCLWEFDGCKGLFCKETNVSLKITYIDTYIRLLKPPPVGEKLRKNCHWQDFLYLRKNPRYLIFNCVFLTSCSTNRQVTTQREREGEGDGDGVGRGGKLR